MRYASPALPGRIGGQMKIPTLRVSAWTVFTATLALTLATWYSLNVYTTVHWGILQSNVAIAQDLESMRAQPHVAELAKTDGQLARLLQQIGDESKKANDAGFRALSLLEAYRGTGLLALLVSLLSVFTRPRWLCLATLPLGALSFVQAHVVM